MPRPKNWEKQVANLQKQLKASQQQMKQKIADLEAKRIQDVEEAANLGYELGQIDAQEREMQRDRVIAEAVAKFEKEYAKKSPNTLKLKKIGKGKTGAKRRGRPAKKSVRAKVSTKRRGRPPKSTQTATAMVESTQSAPAEVM